MQSVFKESFRAPPHMGGGGADPRKSKVGLKSCGPPPLKLCSKQYIIFKMSILDGMAKKIFSMFVEIQD